MSLQAQLCAEPSTTLCVCAPVCKPEEDAQERARWLQGVRAARRELAQEKQELDAKRAKLLEAVDGVLSSGGELNLAVAMDVAAAQHQGEWENLLARYACASPSPAIDLECLEDLSDEDAATLVEERVPASPPAVRARPSLAGEREEKFLALLETWQGSTITQAELCTQLGLARGSSAFRAAASQLTPVDTHRSSLVFRMEHVRSIFVPALAQRALKGKRK